MITKIIKQISSDIYFQKKWIQSTSWNFYVLLAPMHNNGSYIEPPTQTEKWIILGSFTLAQAENISSSVVKVRRLPET